MEFDPVHVTFIFALLAIVAVVLLLAGIVGMIFILRIITVLPPRVFGRRGAVPPPENLSSV